MFESGHGDIASATFIKGEMPGTPAFAPVETEHGLLVSPAPILGKIDYLLRFRLGNTALLRLANQCGEYLGETISIFIDRFRTDGGLG